MNLEINIFTWKGYEQCVREETAHLATLKSNLLTVLKRLQRLKLECQKIPSESRHTDGKNMVWFGKNRKKISQIIKDYTFTYHSSS